MYAYVGEFNITKYRAAVISWIGVAVGVSTILMPCKVLIKIFYQIQASSWEILDFLQFYKKNMSTAYHI